MAADTLVSSETFFTYLYRSIFFVEMHQGLLMEFWYYDEETDTEFDVRELPAQYMGTDRNAVLVGDRRAHQNVIMRAIDGGFDFVSLRRKWG